MSDEQKAPQNGIETQKNDAEKNDEDEYGWDDIAQMTPDQVTEELVEQRKRFESMERDLFKAQTAARKLSAQVKSLSELNAQHGVTHNNTSSAFTLPSEFKKLWDELVTELILDAFPDFLEQYKPFCCLVQELFIVVRQLILDTKHQMVVKMATELRLLPEDADSNSEKTKQVTDMLQTKLQSVFKDYSTQVFSYTTEQIKQFIEAEYKPRCQGILSDDEDALDMFEDNVGTPDFIRFVQAIIKLQLHMVLNDPPIELSMLSCKEREDKTELVEKYEFWMFNKNDYYCIDGFPREGYPCVVVLPPPYRQGYVYQGIKPAVIVLSDSKHDDMLMDHVHVKQEAVIEKLKQKRASSLATVKEQPLVIPKVPQTKNMGINLEKFKESKTLTSASDAMINIKKIEVPKAPQVPTISPQVPTIQIQNNDTNIDDPVKDSKKEEASATIEVKENQEIFEQAVEVEAELIPQDGRTEEKVVQDLKESSDNMNDKQEKEEDGQLEEKNPAQEKSDHVTEEKLFKNNYGDDETEIRESGPLESNDPKSSTGKIETSQSASLTQRNEEQYPEMMELPLEVIKSSRTRIVEVNLPPRGTLNSARMTSLNPNNQNRELLSSPSPQFQSRRMDRKIGESEEEDQQVPQVTMTNQSYTEPAPAPSPVATSSLKQHDADLDEIIADSEHRSVRSLAQNNNLDDDYSEEESYTRRLIDTDKSLRNQELLSDSRVYTIESQEGGVQEFHGDSNDSEVRAHFQRQMKNLAESYKGKLGNAIQKEVTNSSFENQSQPLKQSLTADQDDYVPAAIVTSKRNMYEMPQIMPDSISVDLENIENVNSSANKKYRKMFSPSNINNSPYFQSTKFSMQAAKNQVNASTTSISNVYKRDRSTSNNASKRPPMMPTSTSMVSHGGGSATPSHQQLQQTLSTVMLNSLPTSNSPHKQNSLLSNGMHQNPGAHLLTQQAHHNTLESQYSMQSGLKTPVSNYNGQLNNQGGQQQMHSQHQMQSMNGSNASIIAEMHYQRGMTDIKQDLQRKIVTYQSILKKTYAQAEKEKQAKKIPSTSAVGAGKVAKGSRDGSIVKGSGLTAQAIQLAQPSKRKQSSTTAAAALEQRCQPSKMSAVIAQGKASSSKSKQARGASKEKVESLDQLKSAYFAKMQSLTKKLDNERVIGNQANQSHHKREDSQSRSKSPMQPWKNMPRQMPSSMKDVYVPAAASIPVSRKSLSRGKSGGATNPTVGNKQVSIKQGLKTTMTANSGQFFQQNFHPGKNTVRSKHSKGYIAKRNSIYASSDSSDDIVRGGDIRRGSAPMTNDKVADKETALIQTTGHRRRQQQAEVNTYVFTSDSDGDDDSDSDSDDSIDVNQRVDVYQPASHLRKAINVTHGGKVAAGGGIASRVTNSKQGSNSSALYGHVRHKSTGKRESSANTNRRNQSKSNTRAKNGIQSVQNRTAVAGISDRKVSKQSSNSGLNFFNTSGTEKPQSLIQQNTQQNQSYVSGSQQKHSNHPNRTVQQISNNKLGSHHQQKDNQNSRQQLHRDVFVSPKQGQQNLSTTTKHHQNVGHQKTIDTQLMHPNHSNRSNQQHNVQQMQQQHAGNHRSQGNLNINQHNNNNNTVAASGANAVAQGGFQPIYNLRSQAQINLLENHRLTESNISNMSAYERVVNPVNDHHNPGNYHGAVQQQSTGNNVNNNSSRRSGNQNNQMLAGGPTGYAEARSRHTIATAMVNNYV